MEKQPRPGEFELIAKYFAPLAAEPGAFALTDDAAVLAAEAGAETVVTTDTMVEGVHFPAATDAAHIAARLLRVNLSDLAAMGAQPWAYTLSLALPGDWDEAWVAGFAQALGQEQETFGLGLIGGDTVATPGPLTLGLTVLGRIEAGRVLRRSGAAPGDSVYVSGTIGDAALGLRVLDGRLSGLEAAHAGALADRFHRPRPRLALGRALAGVAHAAIDVSDGLIADLGHVAQASGCAALLERDRVPLSDAARAAVTLDPALMDAVLTGGDDYELLFTAPPDAHGAVEALVPETGTAVSRIGRIDAGDDAEESVTVVDGDGTAHRAGGGYRHF